MAKTTQSVQRAAQVAAAANFASSSKIDDARQIGGAVQYAFIDVVIDALNVQGDVIDLIELPPGSIVIPELSEISVTDDMSSGTVNLDIGDAVDPDRYCDGAVCSAVGFVRFITPAIPAGYTTRHEVVNTGVAATTTNLIQLTLTVDGATTEAGALRVILAYKTLSL